MDCDRRLGSLLHDWPSSGLRYLSHENIGDGACVVRQVLDDGGASPSCFNSLADIFSDATVFQLVATNS